MLKAVRGAIDVSANSPEAIAAAVQTLMETLVSHNNIEPEAIIGLFFTATPDLDALNPALALRRVMPQAWGCVPMLCSQELPITGMMPRCLRVLIQWDAGDNTVPVVPAYLGAAQALRPDLA